MPLYTDLSAVDWPWRWTTAPRRARHATMRSNLAYGPCGTAKSLRHEVTLSGALYSFHDTPRLPMTLYTDLLAIDWSWQRATALRHARYVTTRLDSVCGRYGPATLPHHDDTSSGALYSFHDPPRLPMHLCTDLLAVDWS